MDQVSGGAGGKATVPIPVEGGLAKSQRQIDGCESLLQPPA
jgi:hypothetical protein